MIIRMLKNTRGSCDPMGRFVQTYEKDKTYPMDTPWQREVAQAFIDMGRAIEVQAGPEIDIETKTQDGAATETDGDHPKIKASAQWFRLRAYAEKLNAGVAPQDKAECLEILRRHGALEE